MCIAARARFSRTRCILRRNASGPKRSLNRRSITLSARRKSIVSPFSKAFRKEHLLNAINVKSSKQNLTPCYLDIPYILDLDYYDIYDYYDYNDYTAIIRLYI